MLQVLFKCLCIPDVSKSSSLLESLWLVNLCRMAQTLSHIRRATYFSLSIARLCLLLLLFRWGLCCSMLLFTLYYFLFLLLHCFSIDHPIPLAVVSFSWLHMKLDGNIVGAVYIQLCWRHRNSGASLLPSPLCQLLNSPSSIPDSFLGRAIQLTLAFSFYTMPSADCIFCIQNSSLFLNYEITFPREQSPSPRRQKWLQSQTDSPPPCDFILM